MVAGIRRAPVQGPVVAELRDAIGAAAAAWGQPLVCLSAFRLSPRFPLAPGFDGNVAELADLLRVFDRHMVAHAQVHEFDGIRAGAMRLATRAVVLLARPKATLATFERVSDAAAWLALQARAVGAAEDVATYLGLYREADVLLARMDEEPWRVASRAG